jgi:hypothetical protein
MSEDRASHMADELFASLPGQQQEKSMGGLEAAALGIKEGVGAFVKGAMDAVYSDSVQHFVEHGSHELASALFGQGQATGFVMYPRGDKDDHGQDGHGVHGKDEPAQEAPSMEGPQQEQQRSRGR